MRRLDPAARKNRADQLNPLNKKYLLSRIESLRAEDVKVIQRAEAKANGRQIPGGLGAQAQSIIDRKE